jgi:drug/metabolite transporter (DMT)-like permease
MFGLSLALAVLAAASNALSSVMQRKANISYSDEEPLTVRTAGRVIRRPAWLIGFGAMLTSFAMQAAALGVGELSAVEPVLVIELPMTLLLSSLVFRRRLHGRDWIGIVGMTVGLSALIGALSPSGGRVTGVTAPMWIAATAASAAAIGGTWAAALLVRGRGRSALFGIAAGTGFGLTASLIKADVDVIGADGVAAVFRTWQLYAIAVSGLLSVWLVQNALHSGTLVEAQPGITLLDPIVSVLWGVLVFQESVNRGPVLAIAVIGGVVVGVSVFLLVRASVLHPQPPPRPDAAQTADTAGAAR